MKKALIAVVALLALWFVWSWGFCRFYVPPGYMAVVTAKFGKPLPPGQLLARPGEKGVLEEVFAEGRHLLNPLAYAWEIMPALVVPPGKAGVVTAKFGDDLPPGEFLADDGQMGIRRRVLGPGRYRLNPVGYAVQIVDLQSVPVGFAGVVTSLSGQQAAPGAFAGAGEKGVRGDVLQPGLYYINPREYAVEVVEVGVNQVSLTGEAGGVVITKNWQSDHNNEIMNRLNRNVALEQVRRQAEFNVQQMANAPQSRTAAPPPAPGIGERFKRALGVADSIVAEGEALTQTVKSSIVQMGDDPGAYPRRLMEERAPALRSAPGLDRDGRSPMVDGGGVAGFVLNQFVNFPSRDGFDISLDMTLEFELTPDKLPAIYRDYGDIAAVVDKIIMPQLLSVSRLKGSAYRATDFVAGEGREKFQADLTETLKTLLAEKNLVVHTALISHVNVPQQILEPLQIASLSHETDLTNRELQNTARKQAELNTEMSLITQYGEQVVQETAKLKAEIHAEKEKTVAEIEADTLRQSAAIERDTAAVRGQLRRVLGQAQADAKQRVEAERAAGFAMRVDAYGAAEAFTLHEFAERLNPDLRLRLIHAGAGTLWTDLEGATFGDLGGAGLLDAGGKK